MKLDRSNGAASTRMQRMSTMPPLPLKTFTWDRIDPTIPDRNEEWKRSLAIRPIARHYV